MRSLDFDQIVAVGEFLCTPVDQLLHALLPGTLVAQQCQQHGHRGHQVGQSRPDCVPGCGLDLNRQQAARGRPDSVEIGRAQFEVIAARRQAGPARLTRCSGIGPVLIEAAQAPREADLVGRGKMQTDIVDRELSCVMLQCDRPFRTKILHGPTILPNGLQLNRGGTQQIAHRAGSERVPAVDTAEIKPAAAADMADGVAELPGLKAVARPVVAQHAVPGPKSSDALIARQPERV